MTQETEICLTPLPDLEGNHWMIHLNLVGKNPEEVANNHEILSEIVREYQSEGVPITQDVRSRQEVLDRTEEAGDEDETWFCPETLNLEDCDKAFLGQIDWSKFKRLGSGFESGFYCYGCVVYSIEE